MRTNFEHLREYEDLFELITSAEATLVAGGNRVTYENAGVNIRRTLEGLLYHLTEKYDCDWEDGGNNYNNLRELEKRGIISQSTYKNCDDIRRKCNPSAHFDINPKSLEEVKADVLDSYEKLYVASYEIVTYYLTDAAVKTYFEQSEYVAEEKRRKEEYEQRKMQQAKKKEEYMLKLTGGAEPRSLYEIVKDFSYLDSYEKICQAAKALDEAIALLKQEFVTENYANCTTSMRRVLWAIQNELKKHGINFYPTNDNIEDVKLWRLKKEMETAFGAEFMSRRAYVASALENYISVFDAEYKKKRKKEMIMNSYEIIKRMILQLSEVQLSKETYDGYKREVERIRQVKEENERKRKEQHAIRVAKREEQLRAEKRAKKIGRFIAAVVWIGFFMLVFSAMAGM